MALDADILEQAILDTLRAQTPVILSDEVLGVDVLVDTDAEGNQLYSTQETRGPVILDADGIKKMRPLARAIAQACIDHFKSHGEVDDTEGRIT